MKINNIFGMSFLTIIVLLSGCITQTVSPYEKETTDVTTIQTPDFNSTEENLLAPTPTPALVPAQQTSIIASSGKYAFDVVITDSRGAEYKNYIIYAPLGSNNQWVKIVINDKEGRTLDTLVINEDDMKTSERANLKIIVMDIRALADGTVVGTDLLVTEAL